MTTTTAHLITTRLFDEFIAALLACAHKGICHGFLELMANRQFSILGGLLTCCRDMRFLLAMAAAYLHACFDN